MLHVRPQPALFICATYTADPIIETLQWWIGQLRLGFELRLAPGIAVIQELLNPMTPDVALTVQHPDWRSRTGFARNKSNAHDMTQTWHNTAIWPLI